MEAVSVVQFSLSAHCLQCTCQCSGGGVLEVCLCVCVCVSVCEWGGGLPGSAGPFVRPPLIKLFAVLTLESFPEAFCSPAVVKPLKCSSAHLQKNDDNGDNDLTGATVG